jgi:DNA-binding GntR family transcriptional regulator
LRHIAFQRIKTAILDRTFEPGETLDEDELMAWLGMSRSPIRAANFELRRVGFLEIESRRYTRVANPEPTTAVYDYQTVGALLGGIVRTTVPALNVAATSELITQADRVIAAIAEGEIQAYESRVWGLVHLLIEYCPNRVLVAATEDILEAKLHRLSLSRLNVERDWDALRANWSALRDAVETADAIEGRLAVELAFQLDRPLTQPAEPVE